MVSEQWREWKSGSIPPIDAPIEIRRLGDDKIDNCTRRELSECFNVGGLLWRLKAEE